MSDWAKKAACAGHENPELWCEQPGDYIAADARFICLARCKARLECGEWALRTGERGIVAGGYRMWDRDDRKMLQEELPDVTAAHVKRTSATYECIDCSSKFTTTRAADRCVACRKGLVPAEPVREWIRELRAAGMTTGHIGEMAGLKPNTISGVVSKTNPPQWVRASTAERVLAVPLPVEAMSA